MNRRAAVAQDVAQRIEAEGTHIFLITLDIVSPEHYHPPRKLSREFNLPV
jgi:thioesterase domain-containing protein